MKYRYLYQTRENENREGEVSASCRADAYARLRRQGIRPYRLIGDDPPKWHRYVVLGSAMVLAVVVTVLVTLFFALQGGQHRSFAPEKRGQLEGDVAFVARHSMAGWPGVFETELDRHLAYYAQPGWMSLAPVVPTWRYDQFVADLALPLHRVDDERDEVRQLKNIVAGLRQELKAYLEKGGTVADYLVFLDTRQTGECEFREQLRQRLEQASQAERPRLCRDFNLQLGGRGLPLLSLSEYGELPKE